MKQEYEKPYLEFFSFIGNVITESEHDNSFGDFDDFEDEFDDGTGLL